MKNLISYSPNSFDSLINYFKDNNVQAELLDKAGLVSEKSSGNGYVDRFRNRIMIPIQDEKGDFIAFGARALEDNQNPKYLNSPDTLVFNKKQKPVCSIPGKTSHKRAGQRNNNGRLF